MPTDFHPPTMETLRPRYTPEYGDPDCYVDMRTCFDTKMNTVHFYKGVTTIAFLILVSLILGRVCHWLFNGEE